MRVIKNNQQEHEISCDRCRSELAYVISDVKYVDEEIFGDWHGATYVECPVCKHKIVLECY